MDKIGILTGGGDCPGLNMAADLAHRGDFGEMVALQVGKIVAVDPAQAEAGLKTLDLDTYRIAEQFFG